jgi:hypothetical protein
MKTGSSVSAITVEKELGRSESMEFVGRDLDAIRAAQPTPNIALQRTPSG